jgi:GTP-binding protein HflX
MLEEQKVQVERVLAELNAAGKPVIEVMNKVDLVAEFDRPALASKGRVLVSGLLGLGLKELLQAIDAALVADPLVEMEFRLPQSEGAVMASLEAGSVVSDKRFEGNLVYLTSKGPSSLLNRYKKFRAARERVAR